LNPKNSPNKSLSNVQFSALKGGIKLDSDGPLERQVSVAERIKGLLLAGLKTPMLLSILWAT